MPILQHDLTWKWSYSSSLRVEADHTRKTNNVMEGVSFGSRNNRRPGAEMKHMGNQSIIQSCLRNSEHRGSGQLPYRQSSVHTVAQQCQDTDTTHPDSTGRRK